MSPPITGSAGTGPLQAVPTHLGFASILTMAYVTQMCQPVRTLAELHPVELYPSYDAGIRPLQAAQVLAHYRLSKLI